jgi:hypothetical protein
MPPPTARALAAERHFRELLAEGELPAPDEVRHDPGEVLFLFHAHKLAVVIELDESGAAAPEPAAPEPAAPG